MVTDAENTCAHPECPGMVTCILYGPVGADECAHTIARRRWEGSRASRSDIAVREIKLEVREAEGGFLATIWENGVELGSFPSRGEYNAVSEAVKALKRAIQE